MKLLNLIIALALGGLLMACSDAVQQETFAAPDKLIPKEQMIGMMMEVQILEAKVIESSKTDRYKAVTIFNNAQRKLFAKYELDSAQYYESEQYYMQDVKLYHEMISAVADSIDYLRNNLTEIAEED